MGLRRAQPVQFLFHCLAGPLVVAPAEADPAVPITGVDDVEARVANHRQVVIAGLPLAGQVVTQEDGIAHLQHQRLQGANVVFPSGRRAELTVGVDQAHHRQDAQAPLRGELPVGMQRRALEGKQEVHRHRLGAELPQCEGHLHEFLVGLPHPRNEAGAGADAGPLGGLHRVDPIGIAVGGADVGIVLLGGVEVVVVAIRPGRSQLLGLVVIEEAQAGADVQPRMFGVDAGDNARHLGHLAT